jgi:hypothetical protein
MMKLDPSTTALAAAEQSVNSRSGKYSLFAPIKAFNRAINKDCECGILSIAKKVLNIAFLLIVPLNILLIPFIALYNCCQSGEGEPTSSPLKIKNVIELNQKTDSAVKETTTSSSESPLDSEEEDSTSDAQKLASSESSGEAGEIVSPGFPDQNPKWANLENLFNSEGSEDGSLAEEEIDSPKSPTASSQPSILKMIEKLGIRQEGRSHFLSGISGIAKGNTRSEEEKDGAKPTRDENQFFNHFGFTSNKQYSNPRKARVDDMTAGLKETKIPLPSFSKSGDERPNPTNASQAKSKIPFLKAGNGRLSHAAEKPSRPPSLTRPVVPSNPKAKGPGNHHLQNTFARYAAKDSKHLNPFNRDKLGFLDSSQRFFPVVPKALYWTKKTGRK